MLAGNILLVAAPERPPRLQLIDFEYMAPNFLAYDIANCFCEHCGFLPFEPEKAYPSAAAQRHFLDAYVAAAGVALPAAAECREAFMDEMRRWVSLFCFASHMWCECCARLSLQCLFLLAATPPTSTPRHCPPLSSSFLPRLCAGGQWALIQAKCSTVDFPYREYADARLSAYARAKAAYPKRCEPIPV